MAHGKLVENLPSNPNTLALRMENYQNADGILQPNTLACMKIAVDLNLFADLVKTPNQSKTASELATNSGAEAALIGQAEEPS